MGRHHAQGGSLYTRGGHRKYLTPLERTRFIEAAEACGRPDLRTLCLALAYTGCRISEALGLTAARVDRNECYLALRSLKRRNGAIVMREVPVPASLTQTIAGAHDLADRDTPLWPISRSQAWRLVRSVMREAGIVPGAHATPRGLRHGFGLHAIRSGVPINLVQRWLGHASMTTTAIYLQAIGDEEREIAARMWPLEASPPNPARSSSADPTARARGEVGLRCSQCLRARAQEHVVWP